MAEKKSRTWILAAAGLVGIQVLVLFGLLKLRHQDTDESREWSLDPKATVEEAAREKESREALGNLPLPEGTRRLTVAGAQAAAPQAEDLLEQARELQNRGQLDLAEKLLGQAEAKAPENNRIRVASALLAEARQDSALALQRWRDCIRASDPSGTTRRLALARARVVEERMRLEQVARQREESLAKNSRKLALAGVVEEKSGGEGRRVTWNVRAVSGNRPLDAGKVGVRVTFFERGPNGVLQKSAGGLPRWEKGPPLVEGDGWRNLSAEARPSAESKYAGYSWQLFYDGELQDERIQPASLRGVLREIPRS